jgi:hypothetical protein
MLDVFAVVCFPTQRDGLRIALSACIRLTRLLGLPVMSAIAISTENRLRIRKLKTAIIRNRGDHTVDTVVGYFPHPGHAIAEEDLQTVNDGDVCLYWLAVFCLAFLSALRRPDFAENGTPNPRAWRYVAQTWAAQDLDALKSLRGRCSRYGAVPKSLKFEFLPELMNKLAAVFEDADGGSTGVRRGKVPASGGVLENKRRGPFVEFAWEIVARLSADRRPNGKTALAAQWEEIRSSRKGTYAYMSVSDSFALVLRKKVIEQAKR